MTNQQVLIVEDEKNLGLTLTEFLNSQGFQCQHASDCKMARHLFKQQNFRPHIILMDIQLPDGNGIELAKEFQQKRTDFLLLFLSAQNDPQIKLSGLEMGAEDYITKPFDLGELMFRLKKALRTAQLLNTYTDEIELGLLKIRFKSYEITTADGPTIPLGQKECAILEQLYSNINTVVSRDEIIEQVWGKDVYPSNRTVDNYIVKLRKIIESSPDKSVEIKSVRGVGYQLKLFN